MVVITLGLTVLLAKLFPFGSQLMGMLVGGMYGPLFGKASSPALFHLTILLANYVPAAVAAMVFVRKSQLRSRLPKNVPGERLILIGLGLIAMYLIPRLFASTIPGGGPAYAVAMFGPFLIIPADILVVIGVARVLLAALPLIAPREPQLTQQAARA